MSDWFLLLVVAVPLLVGEVLALVEVAVARPDLSRLRRVMWFAFLLAVPYVSLAAYVVARPRRADAVVVRSAPERYRRAAQLVAAAERHARGELSDDDYDRAVAGARGVPAHPSRS